MVEYISGRIALVDDHPLTRKGIRTALEELPCHSVIAEGGSATEAVAIAEQFAPDLMVLDINMPGGGVEAATEIGKRFPAIKLLMLTVYDSLPNVQEALKAGAAGYVLKGIEGDELVEIVQKLLNGKKYVSPELAARVILEGEGSNVISDEAPSSEFSSKGLTKSEILVHQLIAQGANNREIARQLSLTEATVKQYASQLFKKLGVKNRVEAALLLK